MSNRSSATVFSLWLLGELVRGAEWVGAAFILVAIYISEWKRVSKKKERRLSSCGREVHRHDNNGIH
ncbi:hypothetical protein [Shouchella lonarensis]|uniref:Uncharacterized protein n=1 Tax=Shouchella lonarensis TaxID=1464122 RepID=A0A1G6NDQ8_9BACI|nr:hypothetical protein [Shouchella lonarensis]SDC65938.1 hypothetical protein SAMN05421737_11253 [Shouchella lonarensis]